jgi:HD-GYP domain-containing protein (c-di-GMP phosphodiesterase class II)
MVTDRPYRRRMSIEQAKEELSRESGKQFDPRVVSAFLKVLDEREARLTHPDSSPAPLE